MPGQASIETLHAQILSGVPIEVRLGKVYAPAVGAPTAVTDEDGELVPTTESPKQRRWRKLMRRLGVQRPALIEGSIAAHLAEGQKRLPRAVRMAARWESLKAKPFVWLSLGALAALVGTGYVNRDVIATATGDFMASAAQVQPAQDRAAPEGRSATSEVFGAPSPISQELLSDGSAEQANPDQRPVPPQVIASLRDLSALPAPVVEKAAAPLTRPLPKLQGRAAPAQPMPAAPQGSTAAEPRPNDMAALDEFDLQAAKVAERGSLPPAEQAPRPAQPTAPSAQRSTAHENVGAGARGPQQGLVVPPTHNLLTGTATPGNLPAAQGPKDVKAQVTWRYGHLGIAAVLPDGVVIAAGKDRKQSKLSIGDRLPNGDLLLNVDPKNDRLTTDKAIVRMQ